ncbi:MAG TPA: hypothetical protein VHG89_03750 [Verrucomicrobiae bacterium]|nr:hypothetical protein [Verrucomicrobiae bacterium]
MTPKQTTFYWSLWRECCQKNGWRMERGRLLHDPFKLNEMGKKVWTMAEQIAIQQHRAVLLDDLRHAVHIVALGRQRSSKDFTNKEFNKVRLVLQLCADFDNLQAQMEQANPEMAERGSFVAFLRKKAHEGLIITISQNAFGTKHWDDLPIEKLRWLSKQLKERQPARSLRTATKTFYRRREYDAANVERAGRTKTRMKCSRE